MIPSRGGLFSPSVRLTWRQAARRHASSVRRGPRGSNSSSSSNAPKNAGPLRISSEYKSRRPSPTNPSSAPHPESDTVLNLWRSSWVPLTGAAVAASLLGFYVFGTAAATFRDTPCSCGAEHAIPTGRAPAMTGDNAEQFDKELNLPEWWMGITSLRREMAARAEGHVLELAMGSGRNLEYYNWDALSGTAAAAEATKAAGGITSFTGLDISADMLDVARRKLVRTVPPMKSSAAIVRAATPTADGQMSFLDSHLRLVISDAHKALPPPAVTSTTTSTTTTPVMGVAADAKYDTIVQTFGLCSVSDPVAVLANLASVVRPDTGRILLLEHGKSWLGIVNGLLDRNATAHFDRYGCWWNRDIQGLVERAAAQTPGLEVVSITRPKWFQLGTLVSVELKVTTGGLVGLPDPK